MKSHSPIVNLFLILLFMFHEAFSWELVWSDEFNGNQLDLTNWNIEITDSPHNNELQAYTDKNHNVKYGKLTIVARKENWGKQHYTSGRINSQNKRDFLYGKFEARMKMPGGKGLWPAFWLMPTNQGQFWPRTGEIDIMEVIGSDLVYSYSTLHFGNSVQEHKWKGDPYAVPGGWSNDFHTYTCVWEPGRIMFYVDGVHFSTRTPADVQPWPFDNGNKFYIILNFAVGGDWPGAPDGKTVFPNQIEVDYVRVYQNGSGKGQIITKDSDIKGGDIRSVLGKSWKECFTPCYSEKGCKSFSWNDYQGGTCWLKSTQDRTQFFSRSGVIAGMICSINENKDISGNDIGQAASKDPKSCCALCADKQGCNAYSWSNWNGGTCFLKSGGALINKPGVSAWTGDS